MIHSVVASLVPCVDCALRRCKAFVLMTDEEVAFMQEFKIGETLVEPGQLILNEGQGSPHLFTIYSGMAVRTIGLSSGRRQVVSFAFPGDFIGLQASVMGEMKHTVEARTEMRLCVFDRRRMWSLFSTTPERAFDLTWIAAPKSIFLARRSQRLGSAAGQSGRPGRCCRSTGGWFPCRLRLMAGFRSRSARPILPMRSVCRWCIPTGR